VVGFKFLNARVEVLSFKLKAGLVIGHSFYVVTSSSIIRENVFFFKFLSSDQLFIFFIFYDKLVHLFSKMFFFSRDFDEILSEILVLSSNYLEILSKAIEFLFFHQ